MIITDHEKVGRSVLSVSSYAVYEVLQGMSGTAEVTTLSEAETALDRNRVPFCDDEILEKMDTSAWNVIKVPDNINKENVVAFCERHFLDPGEYVKGTQIDTRKEYCFICSIANKQGYPNTTLQNQYAETSMDIILYESPNFFVVSEKGAIKQGFLMVCPKKHILSVAQYPAKMMEEYIEVCKDVEYILKVAYGFSKPVAFWEHGSGKSTMSSHKKSIVHAHTHVLIDFTIDHKYLEQVQCQKCSDIRIAKEVKYFSYHEGATGQIYLSMDHSVYVPRQYPRKILAKEMGLPPEQYEWRKVTFSENIDAQVYKLYNVLRCANLPKRIQARTKDFLEGYAMRRHVK